MMETGVKRKYKSWEAIQEATATEIEIKESASRFDKEKNNGIEEIYSKTSLFVEFGL